MTDSRPTVLVVEDEEPLAELYAHHLSGPYRTLVALSGAEALEHLDESVDVVLLDRRMPNYSGDEVLTEITRRDYDCKVAMLTAVVPDSDIVAFPIEAYLLKPVSPAILHQTVEQLLTFADHDEAVQELVRLSLLQVTIERNCDPESLRTDDAYQRLSERLADHARTTGDVSEHLSEAELDLFLRSLVRDMTDGDRD